MHKVIAQVILAVVEIVVRVEVVVEILIVEVEVVVATNVDDNRTSRLTQRTTAIGFLLFFILFMEFKPFEYAHRTLHTLWEQLFFIYFFISNQTLGMIHEAGHGLCYLLPCPQFLTALNGTLAQLAFPLGVALYYKKKDNYLGFLIGLFFLGFSLQYTAWYISTAHTTAIVKASESFLGVDGYHDFHYILSTLGVLKYDGFISGFVKFIAFTLMLYSVIRMLMGGFLNSTPKKREKMGQVRLRDSHPLDLD